MNRFICCVVEFMITAALVACGGGIDSVAVPTVPVIKASVPMPVKKASTVTGGSGVAIHMYQALYGMAPSNALLIDYAFQANNDASTFATRVRHQMTQVVDLYRASFKLATTKGSIGRLGSVF